MEMVNVVIMGVLGMALLVAAVGVLKLMFTMLSSKSAHGMGKNKTPSCKGKGKLTSKDVFTSEPFGDPMSYDPVWDMGGMMRDDE